MPNRVTVHWPSFRSRLEDIENTTADDFIGEFSSTEGRFTIDSGQSVLFYPAFSGGTMFQFVAGSRYSTVWYFENEIEFDNGFDLQTALSAPSLTGSFGITTA